MGPQRGRIGVFKEHRFEGVGTAVPYWDLLFIKRENIKILILILIAPKTDNWQFKSPSSKSKPRPKSP